jgi:hypothetical protein
MRLIQKLSRRSLAAAESQLTVRYVPLTKCRLGRKTLSNKQSYKSRLAAAPETIMLATDFTATSEIPLQSAPIIAADAAAPERV